jgi:phospholipid transport system transporter-binding protein
MLVLPASITNSQARDALRLLAQALPREPDAVVSVDASGLQQLDTSALAVLLECRRLAQAAGKRLELRQPPPKLAALATLYGVEALLLGEPPASP